MAVRGIWIGLLFFSTCSITAGQPPTELEPLYSRSTTFGALRLSYDDFLSIVKKADTVLKSVNSDQRDKPYYEEEEEMMASSGQRRLMHSRAFTQDDLKKAPPVAYAIQYVYKNRHAPITIVVIDLDDLSRFLMVAGTAPDHIDALFSMLQDSISEHGTWFAGDNMWLLIILINVPLSLLLIVLANRVLEGIPHNVNSHVIVTLLMMVLTLPINFWLGRLSVKYQWFPMLSVYRGEASLIARRAPEIQVFGILVTISLSLFGFYYTWRLSRRRASPGDPKNLSDR